MAKHVLRLILAVGLSQKQSFIAQDTNFNDLVVVVVVIGIPNITAYSTFKIIKKICLNACICAADISEGC